jgi:hypothetical protein
MDKNHPEYEMTTEEWWRYSHFLMGECWICGAEVVLDPQGKCNYCNGSWLTEEDLNPFYKKEC